MATGELTPDIPQNASQPDELYTPIVARYLRIQDTTWGEAKSGFIVRYRGNLYNDDSAAAYDQLAANLRTFDITPLFRTEAGLHTIVLIKGVVKPKPSKSWVPILLLALTIFSVLFAGTLYAYNGPPASSAGEAIRNILANVSQGIPFAVGLLSILLAHEFGHYLAGRFHRTAVTLPYFIPFPLSYFGTMGAFIQLKEPEAYVGALIALRQERRGIQKDISYITKDRVQIHYELPLNEIVMDFYDRLKSLTKGYASLDYELSGYSESDLVKLDMLLNGEPVDALSLITHRDKAPLRGRQLAEKFKEVIPRQLYEVVIQAAIGAKVIAWETVKALRKNVLAKCYGGDVTRKRKLLEKQKEGKKRMKQIGSIELPQEAFLEVLKVGD